MKIQTMSVVAGDERCNAHCPFCIGKVTINEKLVTKSPEINKPKLRKAVMLAKQGGVTHIIITGKGEPTLNLRQITEFVKLLSKDFPFIELQTNGLNLLDNEDTVKVWADNGLTAISISVVHFSRRRNAEIYTRGKLYPDLNEITKLLHRHGILARLNFTMMHGYISSTLEFQEAVNYSKEIGVDHLTFRPLSFPTNPNPEHKEINDWIMEHTLNSSTLHELRKYPEYNGGIKLMQLPHGGVVYDFQGQNLCMTDCLTMSPSSEDGLRQIIFYPSGKLTYDWQYKGAILMR